VVIRVALADDDREVLDLLRALLTTDPGIECVFVATTAPDVIALTDQHRPDVLVLDIQMGDTNGLDTVSEVRRRHPDQRIVMLTTFGERTYIQRAIALAVDGFLLKSGDLLDLVHGIRVAHEGGVFLAPPVAAMVAEDLRRTMHPLQPNRTAQLSPRQSEVLDLLASGLSNAEIGTRLHVSEATVKAYVSALFLRLEVRNRVEAAFVRWREGDH
jgi:DNA-binding NarL/FixJ family response regulator